MKPDPSMTVGEGHAFEWHDARDAMAKLELSASRLSSQRFAGVAGLVLAIALFLSAGVFLSLTLDRLSEALHEVQQSDDASFALNTLQSDLSEASVASRSAMLSGDIQPGIAFVERARTTAITAVTNFAREKTDSPQAQRDVATLSGLVAARMDALVGMLSPSNGPSPATRLHPEDARALGEARMLENLLMTLRTRERANLVRQQVLATEIAGASVWIAVLAAIAAPACGVLGIVLLLRERARDRSREIQNDLMHAQRLAMMGETSSMLAHEINQPLAAATNYVSALQRLLASPAGASAERLADVTQRAGQQLQRTSNVLKRLRNFIEKRDNERGIEEPSALIEDCILLLGTIDETVPLRTRVSPGLPAIIVDRVQLQQVLVNLMRNAVEAMRQSPRRELEIAVDAVDQFVCFSVSDTGPGLAADVADRLFKPFVTTKPDGMGVGLSICSAIVAAHGGRIWAESNPEGGTIFRFTIPALGEAAAA